MADIVSINKKVTNSKKKKEKIDKPTVAQLYRTISGVINDKGTLPRLKANYHVIQNQNGTRSILKENKNREVQYIHEKGLAYDIIEYTENELYDNDWYVFTLKNAREAGEVWQASTPVKSPKLVAWKSDEALAFKRLDFDYNPNDIDCPTWFQLMGNMITNQHAFKVWVGSLFEEEADRSQYLWLFGEGQNGKSSIARFFKKLFAHASRFIDPPRENDAFWSAQLPGVRLFFLEDVDKVGFIRKTIFKSITGGEHVLINAKNQPAYDAKINGKFLVTSNEMPVIGDNRADRRRLIFCEFKSGNKHIDDLEARLWAEREQFINLCYRMFLEECYPAFRPINVSEESFEQVVDDDDDDEDFEEFFDTHFKHSPGGYVVPKVFQSIVKGKYYKREDYKGFKDFIAKKYKCSKRTLSNIEGKPKGWINITQRHNFHEMRGETF